MFLLTAKRWARGPANLAIQFMSMPHIPPWHISAPHIPLPQPAMGSAVAFPWLARAEKVEYWVVR